MKNFILIVFILSVVGNALAQTVQSNIPNTNDKVYSIVRYANIIYVGGEFDSVGTDARSYLAAIDANTGAVLPWNPSPNDKVEKMLIVDSKLVVIGRFDTIAGANRKRMCVFDLSTGNLLNSNMGSSPNGLYRSGNYVYYSDSDSIFNRAIRRFDINTLQQDLSWKSTDLFSSGIKEISIHGDYIYAVGHFDIHNGSMYINDFCRFRISDGTLDTSFYFNFDINYIAFLYGIAAHNGKVYVAGNFSDVDGIPRNGIVEIDTAGFVTSKIIYCSNHYNRALTVQGNTLWIGGNSFVIGGFNRFTIAQVDITTGLATCWTTMALSGNTYHYSIWASNDTVYVSPSSGGFKAFTGNPGYANLGSDTTICQGSTFSLLLNAPTGLSNYLWSNGATSSAIFLSAPVNTWFSATSSAGCKVSGFRKISMIPAPVHSEVITICSGSSYTFPDGTTQFNLTNSFTYNSLLSATTGCDSIISTTINIPDTAITNLTAYVCYGASYTFPNGTTMILTSTVIDTSVLTTSLGACDSIIITTVNVTIPNIVSYTGSTLVTSGQGISYQWLVCNNGYLAITGATNNTFTPQFSREYAVEITNIGCIDTSNCLFVNVTGIEENSSIPIITVSPNPTFGSLLIDFGILVSNAKYTIENMKGQKFQEGNIEYSRQIKINLPSMNGMYFMRLMLNDDKNYVVKLIKY